MTFSSKTKSVSSKTKPLCQGLSCQERLPRPGESFLVGEALAFRDVFQQTQIGFIENEISLPRAPLIGKTPPAGGGGTEVPKGERLAQSA